MREKEKQTKTMRFLLLYMFMLWDSVFSPSRGGYNATLIQKGVPPHLDNHVLPCNNIQCIMVKKEQKWWLELQLTSVTFPLTAVNRHPNISSTLTQGCLLRGNRCQIVFYDNLLPALTIKSTPKLQHTAWALCSPLSLWYYKSHPLRVKLKKYTENH